MYVISIDIILPDNNRALERVCYVMPHASLVPSYIDYHNIYTLRSAHIAVGVAVTVTVGYITCIYYYER